MINLVESVYALRILWGYIKCLNIKHSLKYLVIPFTYLAILLLMVPEPKIIVNELNNKKLDSYVTPVTNEDKLAIILEKYNLSKNEFNVLSAIVLSEAETNSYEDAYAVINTIYNRTHCKKWVTSVSSRFGNDKGKSLYYQAISPNQFVVYQSGIYKKNLSNTDGDGYQAIIDFLYTEDVLHDYLSFRAHNIRVNNSESFSANGNNYFNKIIDSNRI